MPKLFQAAKSFGSCISKELPAASLTGSAATLFKVTGGPIKITNLALYVKTALPAGANTVKFRFTPAGGTITDLSGATDTASAALNIMFACDGVKATGAVKTTDAGILAAGQALHMPIVVTAGTVGLTWSAGPPATGAMQAVMEYVPLSQNTKVSVI